ncbi:MAG: prolyl oligopeptidase family serine peptidase [Verrucomicrobiales bacterium]|nr:prolyl oligopeptidase family serine peptidase [Verrucomicrobiales bacterium]
MHRLSPVILALTLTAAAHCFAETAKPEAGKQVQQSFTHARPDGTKAELGYWLYLPKPDPAKPPAKPPLVLFLHGSGERGHNLDLVKKHGPPKLIGKFPELDGCIVVSPQCPPQQWWDTTVVKALCDAVIQTHHADENRIYLTGLSMGGFGTWTLLAEHPSFWAAAIPICGGGKPDAAEKFKDVPIWVFHGTRDEAVPLKASEEMIAALKKSGGKPKFTVYPDLAHDCWTTAYNDAETWRWLLQQHTAKRPEK